VCSTLSARKQSSSHMWTYLHMIISCEDICALRVLHTSTCRYVHVNIYLYIYIHVRTNSPIDVAAHNILSSFAIGRHTLQCVVINYEVLRLLLVWRPTAQGGRILCAATSIGLFLLGASHCSTIHVYRYTQQQPHGNICTHTYIFTYIYLEVAIATCMYIRECVFIYI